MKIVSMISHTALAIVASTSVAHAQEAGQVDTSEAEPEAAAPEAPASSSDGTAKLEDIVVTAQRRSEQLQRVPISITATTAIGLERAAITDTQSLAVVTPGLQLNSVRTAVVPFLRGVGTINATAGDEGSTAIYVDGVLNPITAANVFALNNVERVEVLRGPQGTLFGRNAVGGLINVITKEPSHIFGGNAEIGYGNFDTIFGSAYITGGLTDSIAADFAAYGYHQGDGWGRNLFLDVDVNRNREFALRSKVVADVLADTKVTVSGDYSKGESDIGSTRQALEGTTPAGGYPRAGTIYDTQNEVYPYAKKKQYGGSVKVEHSLGDDWLAQSITAYRRYRIASDLDSDGTPLVVQVISDSVKAQTFQQELLLTGSTGPLDATAGVFYYFSTAAYDPYFISRTNFRPTGNVLTLAEQTTNSYAAFAQLTYELAESTRITGGLRYTYDTREIEAEAFALAGHPQPVGTLLQTTATLPESQTDRSFKKLTWRAAIDHDLTDDVLLFGSVSRGFKSGVFSTGAPFAPAVNPETLDAYEVGTKADLFDRTLRLNFSAFYYTYKDIQLTAINTTGIPQLLNAAKGRVQGLDGEITYVVPLSAGSLQFRSSLSVLDTKYTSFPGAQFYFPAPAGGNTSGNGDATGNDFIYSPRFTSSVGMDYETPVGNAGDVALSVTWAYNDGFYWDAQNRVREPAFSLINAQLSFTTMDEAWRARLFVKNLLDTEYTIYTSISPNGDFGAAAAPRTFGVALSRTF